MIVATSKEENQAIPENMSSTLIFLWICVAESLVFVLSFVDKCLYFVLCVAVILSVFWNFQTLISLGLIL